MVEISEMFSIAAINDVDVSNNHWQPLAPTKEAQEFHLTQLYHESLVHLQAGEYTKAQKLFQAIVDHPLSIKAESENKIGSDPMLQLRFLTFRNLAEAYFKQGEAFYEGALECFLQAVAIDRKDVALWNRLGSLACSLGSFNIARWAFEQGLHCSPNHWNCMEKLVEVLVAIGDEVACLSVVKRLLKISPTHPRAELIRRVIEENADSDDIKEGSASCGLSNKYVICLCGIDKLKPQHYGLSFSKKRKLDESKTAEPSLYRLERFVLNFDEASWSEILDKLVNAIEEHNSEAVTKVHRTKNGVLANSAVDFQLRKRRVGEIELTTAKTLGVLSQARPEEIQGEQVLALCCSMEYNAAVAKQRSCNASEGSLHEKACGLEEPPKVGLPADVSSDKIAVLKERDVSTDEEPPLERRSTRLERIRTRKFDKSEELENIQLDLLDKSRVSCEDLRKLLEPFIVCKDCLDDVPALMSNSSEGAKCHAVVDDDEEKEVLLFLKEYEQNSGLYHIAQQLLQRLSLALVKPLESWASLLRLEKCIRGVSKEVNVMYSLFLAEVYVDILASGTGELEMCDHVEGCEFHLCKILDNIAATIPNEGVCWDEIPPVSSNVDLVENLEMDTERPLNPAPYWWPFWVRYYWVSGCLRALQGSWAKGKEDFQRCLSILESMEQKEQEVVVIHVLYCKSGKEISVERVKRKFYELQMQDLLTHSASRLLEQGNHDDLIELLTPILFPKDGATLAVKRKHTTDFSIELAALNMLIHACEELTSRNFGVALQCYVRRVQIHLVTSGFFSTEKSSLSIMQESIREVGVSAGWCKVVAEEIKLISQCMAKCAQQLLDNSSTCAIEEKVLGHMQQLLLATLCYMSTIIALGKSSGHVQQLETACFVDAAVAFCRLQHLHFKTSVKRQVELLVTVHDVLAERGLCCAGKYCEGGEGVFLKMAIKHLLFLEMKLKIEASQLANLSKDTGKAVQAHESEKILEESIAEQSLLKSNEEGKLTPLVVPDSDDCLPGHKEAFSNEGEDIPDEQVDGIEKKKIDIGLDIALDQNFFCLYGLNLRGGLESTGHDGLAAHANTSLGDYQTKEQCAEVFQYILPYARVCSKTCLVKLRKVLRAIRKHFPDPPLQVLEHNGVDRFLESVDFDEAKLSSLVLDGGDIGELLTFALGNLYGTTRTSGAGSLVSTPSEVNDVPMEQQGYVSIESHLNRLSDDNRAKSEPYSEVYGNLFYLLTQVEEMCASDKWPGFVFTKEGEEFVEQNVRLFKYDLLYNSLRFESWHKLANLFDEEVDLMLNDGSKTRSAMDWHKDTHLTQRVKTGRQRTRRCLFMSLALAKTPEQQSQVHELLALVYYDSIQNVAPSYNQRQHVAARDDSWRKICEKSYMHFEKALHFKSEWLYLFYLGKLCEKLGQPCEKALLYYQNAAELNPSAVDPVYRLHASRLKLLCSKGTTDLTVTRIVAKYNYLDGTSEKIAALLDEVISPEAQTMRTQGPSDVSKPVIDSNIREIWDILFEDCIKALEVCIEGELKHYHKARYRLTQGLLVRNKNNDVERAKEELGFCFKSNRSPFTINMWEIDGSTKRNRRKTPGSTRGFEISMPESSRKFITCLRKYLLLYFDLCEKTLDVCTLERAYTSLRVDKKFSLCLADMINVALGKYIYTLGAAIDHLDKGELSSNFLLKNYLEKFFNLFMELGSSLSETVALSLTEAGMSSDIVSEDAIHSYIHRYLQSLELENKVDILESVNEKIRKRFKSFKLINEHCARVSRHAALAWCRALVVSIAIVTPVCSENFVDRSSVNEYDQLVIRVQIEELMVNPLEVFSSTNDRIEALKSSNALLSMSGVKVKQVSIENMERASTLLRQTYTFYRDCAGPFPSGIHLYLIPSGSGSISGSEASSVSLAPLVGVDLSVPRKLLLWAYNVVHGHTCSIAEAVKFCEDQAKTKIRKGQSHPSPSTLSCQERPGAGAKEATPSGAIQFSSPSVVDEKERTFPEEIMLFPSAPAGAHRPLHKFSAPATACLTNQPAEGLLPEEDTSGPVADFPDSDPVKNET